MKHTSTESLVNADLHEAAGVITIRRSVLVAGAATALILAALVVWLLHSNAPSALAAEPQPARAADVSTIDEHVNRSDALVVPTSPPAPSPHPDPELLADNGPVLPAQSAPAVAQAPQLADQGAVQAAMDRERARDDRERAREQTIEDARNSDLAVKLDEGEPAQRNSVASVALAEAGPDTGPIGAYVLQRGMIIPASLYTPIDSTVPGIVTAQVREDVYDSTHRTLLVPAGSRLVGSYANGMTSGQARLFVGFDSIKLPNGHTISLGSMPGVDLQGVAGLGGKVDFHTGRLFSNVVLLSILGAATQLVQPHYSSGGTDVVIYGAGQSAGQQLSTVSSQVANQYLNQPPTMHTPSGFILDVMVEHDLSLPPYTDPTQ